MRLLIPFLLSLQAPADRPLIYGVGTAGGDWIVGHERNYDALVAQRLREVGATSTRIGASWPDIEKQPGVYDWTPLDRDLALCAAADVEPVCLIVNTPAWASPTGEQTHQWGPKPEFLPQFARFCQAVVQHAAGRVRCYELWNEQNGYGWHEFNRGDEFLPLLKTGYEALKAADPDCVVGLGGLDDADGNAPIFLRQMYELGGNRYFDAVCNHPYGSGEDAVRKLKALHDIMAAGGDGHKPFWLTEWGFDARRMTFEEQADAVRDYLETLARPELSYVTIATYLAIADFETDKRGWGLCDVNLRPRPAFHAFRDLSPREKPALALHDGREPHDALLNGGFEGGFGAGLAEDWHHVGEAIWFDGGQPGRGGRARSGEAAQGVAVSRGSLEAVLLQRVRTRPGAECTLAAWTFAHSAQEGAEMRCRIGLDPTGGDDPNAGTIVWSEPVPTKLEWQRHEVSATSAGNVLTVLLHAAAPDSKGAKWVSFDDVQLATR